MWVVFRPKAFIAVIAAALGIAAIPAVGYSTAAGQRHGQYAARSSKAKPMKPKRCKKGQVRRNGKCVKKKAPTPTTTTPTTTTPAPEALSATLIIHVYGCGGPVMGCHHYEDLALLVTRLGPAGEALSSIELHPESHTVHVAPGEYEVAYLTEPGGRPVTGFDRSARATVVAGQEQEIKLIMNVE